MSKTAVDPRAFIDALAECRGVTKEQVSVIATEIARVEARAASAPYEEASLRADLEERKATIEDLEALLAMLRSDLAGARRKYRLTTTAADRLAVDEAYRIEQERKAESDRRAAEREAMAQQKAAKIAAEHAEERAEPPSDEGSTQQ